MSRAKMASRPDSNDVHLTQPPELIILDFDGVVADSELLANTLLAEFLTIEGLPTTTDQAIARYMGRRWADCEARIAEDMGRALGEDFHERYRAHTGGRMRAQVQPIAGVADFLRTHAHRKLCVASSSNPAWLNDIVGKFGFRDTLGPNLFSGVAVKHGKPAPDIFFYAADKMGVAPERCAVIEDSPAGIEGAVAAGMAAIGFLGGAHIRKGHDNALLAKGAHGLAHTYDDVAQLLKLQERMP